MGEKVQIARQDTLLEVQTTGTQTQNTLDVVNGKIGNLGDTAEEGTLFGQMAGGSGSTGAVKSVQFGTGSIPDGSYSEFKTANIKINTVNPQKCIVLIYSSVSAGYDRSFGMGCYVESLTSNELKIKLGVNMSYSWQVIEFY